MLTKFPKPVRVALGLLLVAQFAACAGGGGAPSIPAAINAGASRPAGATASATASPKLAAVSGVASHMPTMAYDEYYAEGENASSALVQQYVTFAEGGQGNAKAVADCDNGTTKNCSSVFYMDPNFLYASPSCTASEAQTIMTTSNESWFVHESGYSDFANRVQGTYKQNCNGGTINTPVYLLNDANSSVIAFFQSYLQTNANSWDAYYMDDTSGLVLTQAYGPSGGMCPNDAPSNYCEATQEYPTNASVVSAHVSFANGMNHVNGTAMKFFFNGIGFLGSTVENVDLMQQSSRFIGGVCENCIDNASTLRPTMYANVLTAMAQVDAVPGASFVELNTGYQPAGSNAQVHERVVTTAVAWLGYSAGQTVVFPNLEDNTNNLAIWPEDSIVPSEPLESMKTQASDIAVAPGVYVREFAECYDASVPIGGCAAVLNSTSSPVVVQKSWLKQSYNHLLALYGGDVESGGTMSLTNDWFVAGITEVQPSLGTLLLQQ